MKKVESLTPEQEALLPVYREKWLSNGYSTEPLDKVATAESIKWAYGFIGKKKPYMWFCDSPMQAQLLANILSKYSAKELGVNFGANLGANLSHNGSYEPSLYQSYWAGFYDFILNEIFPERKDELNVFNKDFRA